MLDGDPRRALEPAGVAFIGDNGSAMTIVFTGVATWLLMLLACAYSRAKEPRRRRR